MKMLNKNQLVYYIVYYIWKILPFKIILCINKKYIHDFLVTYTKLFACCDNSGKISMSANMFTIMLIPGFVLEKVRQY